MKLQLKDKLEIIEMFKLGIPQSVIAVRYHIGITSVKRLKGSIEGIT
jgi:hypothetical protein